MFPIDRSRAINDRNETLTVAISMGRKAPFDQRPPRRRRAHDRRHRSRDPWPAASIAALYRPWHAALFSRARSSSAS